MIFESDFAKTEYIEKDNVVLHTWKKEAHFDDYRTPVIASLNLLREHKDSIFIVDARNGFEDVKEDVEWGFDYLLPELKKTCCGIWGFILPKISDIEGEIDLWTREIEKNFQVIRAESYEEILIKAKGRKVTVAAVQMQCTEKVGDNLKKAEEMIRKAAADGAEMILLPELFEREYFCQQRRYDFYEYAMRTEDNPAVKMGMRLAAELKVVLPISFYEKDGNVLYNSVACIDADGTLLGVYRKTHIPDDHFYQEKFYFTPGNTGFKVFETKYGRLGIGICWDQWFPETARSLALMGAELIFYPTAIGSEPILGCDSMPHWRRCMQGHSAANLVPVVAANRIGVEKVEPCRENAGQSSALVFFGSSFMTDGTGEIVASASCDREEILLYTYRLDMLYSDRLSWGIFRDRRPECYGKLTNEQTYGKS